jgi:hypothetical protein
MSPKLKIWYCRHSQAEKSKMKSTDLTVEMLRSLLDYDPDTGIFWWRVQPSRRAKAGEAAGCVDSYGYTCIRINGMQFKAHRLAWLHFHGLWPEQQIDHLNGNRADNRIANLRDVSRSMNLQNQTRPQKSNTSGFLGVSWKKGKNRWQALIMVNGRNQHIGYFNTAEAAHAAYLAAKLQLHPGDVRNFTEIPS